MKLVSLLLVSLVVLPALLPAQTGKPQSQPNERVSLEVGSVTVWLGMPKAELTKRFSDAGYEITELGDKVFAHFGTEAHDMRFKNGRLVFADVEWYNSKNDEIDAVIGAIGALANKNQLRPCVVSHEPLSEPDASFDRVFIVCGDRSVLIGKGKIAGQLILDVTERIGQIPETTQK